MSWKTGNKGLSRLFNRSSDSPDESPQLRQAQLALQIAMSFIHVSPKEMEEAIHRALRAIGDFAEADRAYIFQLSGSGFALECTHEWRNEDVEPQPERFRRLAVESLAWFMERLHESKPIQISYGDTATLSRLREEVLDFLAARTIAVVPMTYKNQLIGFIGVDALRGNRVFSQTIIELLQIAATVFVGALERIDSEEAQRQSNERYALAALGANDGIWDWDLRTDHVYYSTRFKAMLGYENEPFGDTPDAWFRRVHPEDLGALKTALTAHLDGLAPHFAHEYRIIHKDGSTVWTLSRALAVRDEQGKPVRMAGSHSDVTQRKRAEEQLLHNAFYDDLTGLPNRALFLDRLAHVVDRLKRHPETSYAVLLLDLDHFKVINDSLGHTLGDELLVEASKRIKAALRADDTLARPGGDEFVVLLEQLKNTSEALRVARRIQYKLSLPFTLQGREVFTSASIGIVIGKPDYHRAEEALRDADAAMYRAKALGRSGHAMFDSELHTRALARLQLESELRQALEREEFLVYYQPIVSTETGRILACEALIRWRHPERGMISPGEFIPIAEEVGLIIPMGELVLRRACHQNQAWLEAGFEGMRVAVNLSARQFQQQGLAQMVARVLREAGIQSDALELEITESIAMQNVTATLEILKELNEMGIFIAIDDFGTGHSSFAYLKRFPIETLKIDQSFVRGLPEDADGAAIVRAIIAMTQSLRLNVRAEGVETVEQLQFLRSQRCPEVQGFFFSRPVDAESLTRLLREGPFPIPKV